MNETLNRTDESKRLKRKLLAALLLAAAACAFGAAALYAAAQRPAKLSVINLNRVVRANEAELLALGLTDEALQRQARRFARNLQIEIEQLQKDCRCTLLVSSAVIAPHELSDLTETLLARLKLSDATDNAALAHLSELRPQPSDAGSGLAPLPASPLPSPF